MSSSQATLKESKLFCFRLLASFSRLHDKICANIQIRFHKRGLEIRLNEKYRPFVIWTGRAVSLLSFVSIWLVGLPPLFAILISLLLWTLAHLANRFVFHYSAFFLQPLPMSFEEVSFNDLAYVIAPDRSVPTMVGLIFKDETIAESAFRYFRALVNGADEDQEDKNIKICAVLENGTYYFYLYPSEERTSLRDFREMQKKISGGRPIMTFTMTCVLSVGLVMAGGLRRFMTLYKNGEPYFLTAFVQRPAGPEPLRTIQPILKHEFKIVRAGSIDGKTDPILYKHYTRIVRTKQHPTYNEDATQVKSPS